MSLSDPRAFFGVHSFTPYNRTTGEFYGTIRVLGGSSLSFTGETVDLLGGSSKYPWAVEDGPITSELALRFSEYPDFMFELALGNNPTNNAAETLGNVSTLTNKFGSLVEATTGIASISAESGLEADLKFGKYVVKAVSATEVDVYASSNVDFSRGADAAFVDDTLKVTATPLVVPDSGATVSVPNFGLEITGGSGTVALTAGETAEFEVRPPNDESTIMSIGSSIDTFPEFGCIVMAQKRGDKSMFEIDLYRCKLVGMPVNFEKDTWSEAEVTMKAFYDSEKDGVYKARHLVSSV